MLQLPFTVDLHGKVAVVTGAGGVLCSMFARALAQCGAQVALLDINEEAAKKNAEEINSEGFTAKGYACNVLEKASCEAAREHIRLDFGTCDILLNGAGGNNPRATTDKEYYEPGDISREDIKTFFNLDPAGVEFVFNLNFLGTLIPTQV
ncbi:MAG: SDR family NAD(P)-dependent oxidoreductase, partial [Neglectibacter sp.]